MPSWVWASASQIGASHLRTGSRLQDANACYSASVGETDFFVAVVSDGAGSASYGGQGAALVCRHIACAVREHIRNIRAIPDQTKFERWLDGARDRIYLAAQRKAVAPREFAATLVCVVSDGKETFIAHVGDGCAVVRLQSTAEWVAPVWPYQGEYASVTQFVTDEPVAALRTVMLNQAIDVVTLFSDGLERMVLDMAAKQPFAKFFDVMTKPVIKSSVERGRDRVLSITLQEYLASDSINARTDDDKTLVLAALR